LPSSEPADDSGALMGLAAVLRLLWRRRIAVAIGAAVALAGAFTLGRSPTPASGVAKTRVVIDTPQSQLAADAPHGVNTLYWRATLLGMLLGTDAARQQMANELHVPVTQVATVDLELTAPAVPASLPNAATQAASGTSAPYVVNVHTDDVLPVVSIDTSAPDKAGAARLASAAVHALQNSGSAQATPVVQGLTVSQVSPIDAREIAGGSGKAKMAAVAVLLFGVWCLGVALFPTAGGRPRTLTDPRPASY
jgi:hypothetical protein